MNPEFWLKRWQNNEIGFHSDAVQPALIRHWPTLGLEKGARVLVPLCGKSLDMVWLAKQGQFVFGCELSEIAIKDFVAEQLLAYTTVTEKDGFKIYTSYPFELWCGDFFALQGETIGAAAVYDRAALVAMPPEMQPRYAAKISGLLPKGGKALLIGLDYDPREMNGPPFNISQASVHELFQVDFDVSLLEVRDGLTKSEHLKKRGVTRLEEATYLLVRK